MGGPGGHTRYALASGSSSARIPAVREFLTPITEVAPRPEDPADARYVRSYLLMRAAVGALGIALPVVLVLTDGLWFDGAPFPRNSLSAYYYSGVRDVMVGAICAIGTFLLAYKVAERNLDNSLSLLAGLTVILVALFPPRLPRGGTLAPLQERLGEVLCAQLHFATAAVFLISLAVLSVTFGIREGNRPPRSQKLGPGFWRAYHFACAGVIAAALIFMGITEISDTGPRTSLLLGETISLMAFGASWLAKGFELDMLRGRPAGRTAARLPEPSEAPGAEH